MINIPINVCKSTRMAQLTKSVLGNDSENLQSQLIFTFDSFVNGTARLEYVIDGEKYFTLMTKSEESYILPIKNVMLKQGNIPMQLVITEGTVDTEIPIFKSNVFYMIVNQSINAQTEEPDGYQQWLDIANTKLNLVDEAIESVENAESIVQANEEIRKSNELTRQANETTRISHENSRITNENKRVSYYNEIKQKVDNGEFNGADFNYNWRGTELGVKNSKESDYNYVDLKGQKGDKGEVGDFNFATFEINLTTGNLIANKTENLKLINFGLNNNGYMTVTI